MKRFCAMMVAVVLAAACLLTCASADTVKISDRYQAVRTAREAVMEKYGLSLKHFTLFERFVLQAEDGWTVVWLPHEEFEFVLGAYTAAVSGGKLQSVVWTHDGEPLAEDTLGVAWGAAMLEQITAHVAETNALAPLDACAEAVRYTRGSDFVPADRMLLIDAAGDSAPVVEGTAATWSFAAAEAFAREQLAAEFGLTAEQAAAMTSDDGECWGEEDKPVWMVSFWLWPDMSAPWQEGNGAYTLTYDAVNGEILDMDYDSVLGANG